MVDDVIAAARLELDKDAAFLHDGGDLFLRPGQRDNVRVEGFEVLGRRLSCIALRVYREEDRLQRGGIGTKPVDRYAHIVERRRAGVRARRVAEVDQDHLPR